MTRNTRLIGRLAGSSLALCTLAATQSALAAANAPAAIPEVTVTEERSSHFELSWTAPSAGAAPIAHYQIYRNAVAYATSSSTHWTDRDASHALIPSYDAPASIYRYQVTAVDTLGNEGPPASQVAVYSYRNGESNWGSSDYSYAITESYRDSKAEPQAGRYAIALTYPAAGGGFQPYANGPQTSMWDLEIGGFNFFTVDVKVSDTNHPFFISHVSRLPPGDVYPYARADLFSYCKPQVGQWVTCKVPLSALSIGVTHFTGSIQGTTLTVSSVQSGVGVDAGGFVIGPGIPPGTYITGYGQNGSVGTFTVAGPGIKASTNVAAGELTCQRTSLYKLDIGLGTTSTGTSVYVDNIGWTLN